MKNIILQHYTGELGELEELSVSNISEYAKQVGAEYRLLKGQLFNETLSTPSQKVYMLDDSFDEYDTVLMLDIDKFVRHGEEENVFDVPGIGLYEDVQKRLHATIARALPQYASLRFPYWGGAIYKMDLATRKHLRKGLNNLPFPPGKPNPYIYDDEGIMHCLATVTKFNSEYNYLPRKWCYCSYLPEPDTAGFIHIRTKITPTGPKRTKMQNLESLVKRGYIKL